jgi:flagellar hook-associated protein 3 FlgL
MRVTQQMLTNDFLRDINKNRNQMGAIQSQLSSGKMVRVPSHDPIAFSRSRVIGADLEKQEQYQSNVSGGLRQARMSQEVLDETLDRLVDIKRIVTQGATATSNAASRNNMAEEIASIKEILVSGFNTSYGDRFLFGGTNSGQAPFRADPAGPGGVSDTSNDNPLKVQIADGVQVSISITGTELRNAPSGDIFSMLDNIEQALRNNDQGTLNSLLNDVDSSIDHTSVLTSRLGYNINRMEFMFEQYEATKIGLHSDISQLTDTDFAKGFSSMQRLQTSFEAAMAVHSQLIKNTLLNYL